MTLSGKPKRFHCNRVEACKILGIAERTLARLEADGVIVPSVRGRGGRPSVYDLTVIVPAYISHLNKRPANGTSIFDARARRDNSQADLNELRAAERRKELLPRAKVVLVVQAIVKASRAKILTLKRRLTQAGVPREHEVMTDAVVREVLEEMSRLSTLEDLIQVSEEAPDREQMELGPEDQPTLLTP